MKPVFENPELVKKMLNLPAVYRYRFVGSASPQYHALLEEILVRIAGEKNIRKRSFRESANGNYTAYRFEVYHDDFSDIEAIYREVGALKDTHMVL